MYIDLSKHGVGLGGGQIISGSRQVSFNGNVYRYRPITTTVADIKFSDISGSFGSNTIAAGVDVYGGITQVTQSSGVAMIYYGVQEYDITLKLNSITPPSGLNS